ncbi:MAG: hypothetical protein ACLR70_04715, partial [Streptococcus thermophilus]
RLNRRLQTESTAPQSNRQKPSSEVLDMEAAVAGEDDHTYLNYSRDVMELMTQLRKDWGLITRRRVAIR